MDVRACVRAGEVSYEGMKRKRAEIVNDVFRVTSDGIATRFPVNL